MLIKLFAIPVGDSGGALQEMNAFWLWLQTLGLSEARVDGDAFGYKRWALQTLGLSEAIHDFDAFATNVGCYKRWALQTLGLSEAIRDFDAFATNVGCYKRWVLQTLGLSEAIRDFDAFATNVGCYKRWASPRPGSRGMPLATNVGPLRGLNLNS